MNSISINHILNSDKHLNKNVSISGWVRTFRANRFIALNDGSCLSNIQCVVDFEKTDSLYLRLLNYNVWSNGLINNNRLDEHKRIFESVGADIITYQECGNTTYNDVLSFLNTNPIYYPYIYPDLNSGNLTISKYPSLQSWQVSDRIDAELIDLPDDIYATDILIINGHPQCCGNNEARQENFDAFIQFIIDAKTVGGVIDLPTNTPISFSGDMNLVGYAVIIAINYSIPI